MPKKTKADLEKELENLSLLYNREIDANFLLRNKLEYLEKFSSASHTQHMVEAVAKIGHALRKTLELEKTGKSTSF